MFHKMVDLTEPICQMIDSSLADVLTFDTSGIELYVMENNPKTLNSLIKRLKAYYKDNPDVDPYKMAYGLMPSLAASCPKSDSPDEDKSVGDSCALHPVLTDYFALHPQFSPDTFLGDSAFDTIETYGLLKDEFHFSRALIPYNVRNESTLPKVGYNLYGYPTCPNDSSLAMKYLGHCDEKGRADREKWGCPKVHMVKGQYVCDCEHPCSTAKKGRTSYTYENMDFRKFPGIQRDSDEWISLYKIRTIVERAINHLKINMCIAGRKSPHHIATKADVFLAGIASQFTVVVAHRLSYPQYLRSLKPLIV